MSGRSSRWRRLPGRRTWLTAVAAACLLAACLEPEITLPQRTFDYVITLDITQSMNTTDTVLDGVRMSRIAYAKRLLQGLLPRLPCGSRVGWAIFTEYRVFLLFTPVEVCANYDALAQTLRRIDNDMAWAGGSEIARGLFAGLEVASRIPGKPAFVFITDGQEAPPVNPEFRPAFDGTPGAVPGVILGVGGHELSPIPKIGRDGRFLGYWSATEVPQTDSYSAGRATSRPNDLLYNQAGQPIRPLPPSGTEQLSSLKSAYLRSLALETGLQYRRLDGAGSLYSALTQRGLARTARVRTPFGFAPAALALVLLIWLYWPRGTASSGVGASIRGTDVPKLPL
jgi:mxaL protein